MRFVVLLLSVVLLFGCIGQKSAVNLTENPANNSPLPNNQTGSITPSEPTPQPSVNQTPTSPSAPPPTVPPNQPTIVPPSQPINPANTINNSLPPVPTPGASTIPSQEISYYSSGWTIFGTLYPNKNSQSATKLILLVPMLDKTRDSYPQRFIERLHDEIPDAMILAIDARGNGKSTNLGSWKSFDSAGFMDMKTDILSARKYFAEKYPTVKSFYVVGASIGSTAAILAGAQDNYIGKIVMLSPGMSYQDVNIQSSLSDYRHDILVVATTNDRYSAQAASTIASVRNTPETTTKIYDGSAHGTDMFESTNSSSPSLSDLIRNFLKN
ncbi:alpha/beta hydrolase [Candidatus Micrarchaeota archaeon]|nr:alpha/beta hydrolase [Candidatus Micrarchaeota archaeon]